MARMSPIARYSKKSDTNASRRVLLIVALCLFVVALSLVIIQSVGPSSLKIKTYSQGYSEGYVKAATQASAINPMASMPVPALSANIVKINGNTLTVNVTSIMTDKNIDGIGAERQVVVTKDTQISLIAPLKPEDLAKQVKTYMAQQRSFKPGAPSAPPMPPSPNATNKITIADLKVGDVIAVYGDGSDLKNEATITAKAITVNARPS